MSQLIRAAAHLANVSSSNTADVIQDIDTPVPAHNLKPPLWKILAMPVGMRRKSKGGILMVDETLDVQNWTHQLYKIVAVGPHVFRGKAYESYDITDAERPQVGQIWIIDSKQPRRFQYKGHTLVVITDDSLNVQVDPADVENLKFNGVEL